MSPLAPLALIAYSLLAATGDGAHATRRCVDLHPLTHRFTVLDGLLAKGANVTCPSIDTPTVQPSLAPSPSNHNFSFSFHGTGVRVLGDSQLLVERLDRPSPEVVRAAHNEALDLPLAPYFVSGTGALEGIQIYTYTQGLNATYTPQAGIFCNHTSFHGYLSGRWATHTLPRHVDGQSHLGDHPYIVPKSGDAVAHLLPPPGATYIEVVTIGPGPFSIDITPSPPAWSRMKGYAPCEAPSTAVVWPLDPEVHYEVAVSGPLVGARVWTVQHKSEEHRLWCYDRKQDNTEHEEPDEDHGQKKGISVAQAVILAVVITLLIGVPVGVAAVMVVRWRRAAEMLREWLRERQERMREGRVKLPDQDAGQPVSEPVD